MRKGTLNMNIIRNLRKVHGMCPVCGGPLKYNIRTGVPGQWAHLIRNTKGHIKRYGKEVVQSEYNGLVVCSLHCNNAVQLSYCSQPVLCNELAEEIREKIEIDKETTRRLRAMQ